MLHVDIPDASGASELPVAVLAGETVQHHVDNEADHHDEKGAFVQERIVYSPRANN